MSDCIYTIDQIKMYLAPVLSQYNVKSATLFGSYGKGSANASSDVDLLVDSGLKGLKFVGLIEALRAALDNSRMLLYTEDMSPAERYIRHT